MATIHGQTTDPSIYGKGKRWAVLVGINEYQDRSNYGNLHVCVHDATKIRNVLITGGFETSRIHLLTDKESTKPLKEEIVAHLQSVVEATEPDDLLLFYFSGHGAEENGESYLVPCNGKGVALFDTALPLKRVKEIIDRAQARAKVIILDACHSGANIGAKGPWSMPEDFIDRVFGQAEGLAILSSCKQGQHSYEWPDKNCSVYTYYLLEALQGKADDRRRGFITVSDINMYTVNKVTLWASQHQVRQKPYLNYFVDGEILLVYYQKLGESAVNEEGVQQINAPEVSSEQRYLIKLQEITQDARIVFRSQEVWGADCQPVLQALNQLKFPSSWETPSSSSFVESPLYDIVIQLHYIEEQKSKVISLIKMYMRDQQGSAKRRETQIKEINSIFTLLVQEIEAVQKSVGSLEGEQINLLLGAALSPQQQENLEKYIGSIDAFRYGRVHEQITNRFISLDMQYKQNKQIIHEDFFSHFKRIPLHALFLYTSEDKEIPHYVLNYWDRLAEISEEFCDFHPMLSQFNGTENGYTDIWKIDVVRQSGFQSTSDLPAIFFHDNHGISEYISLATAISEGDIKRILRVVFDAIRQQPTIASVVQAKQSLGQQRQLLMRNNFNPSIDKAGTSSLNGNVSDEANKLLDELRKLPSGDGRSYEKLVKRVLDLCLADDFALFVIKEQVRTLNQKRIRDFIIDNRGAKVEFWHEIKILRGIEKILFDAKNYEDKISYTEITSTLRYLKSKAFGNFMIIVSRRGISDLEEIIEDYGDEDKVVLFLDDNDLISMIELKKKGERASLIIENKYYDFLDMK